MKILFAEDEVELSDAISLLLKRNDYSVDSVYDGQEALDYLDASDYDLIILDIMMPKVDGLTVLKKIRSQGKDTPVLILTAKSQPDDVVKGLDLGADDYLTKPFNIKVLLARIRALTRRDGPVQDENLTYGNLTLNRQSCEILVGKESIKLVNKELQIMELLLKNPTKIVPTDTILNSAWNSDECSTEENVYVFVSYLRRKLKQLNSNVEIKAYRNQGYGLNIIQ
ncbi:MAG: response regulator transcription factor [Bacilli bacterium]|jgi:two-component system response regulator ArlR|nr:response regulator transcription factor [Bacilli bacterium]